MRRLQRMVDDRHLVAEKVQEREDARDPDDPVRAEPRERLGGASQPALIARATAKIVSDARSPEIVLRP